MKLPLALFALLCSTFAIACAGLTQASTPRFVYGEPEVVRYETTRMDRVTLLVNVWERPYAVPGASISEIGDSLEAFRRTGSGHGPYSASTKWDLKFSLRYDNHLGTCRIANATVEIVGVITLPALAEPEALDATTLARWQSFIENLRAHEMEHVSNGVVSARTLQADLEALPDQPGCGAIGEMANALAEQHEQAILAADARLDAETKHGALTGATFP